MSTRSFADGRKLIGNKTSAKGRLDAAVLAGMEPLEKRQMLNAAVLPANPNPIAPSGSAPLPAMPGQTFYENSQSSSNAYQWASAITPNTVNDLVLNTTAYAQSFTGCCEGTNSAIGNTGSVNNGRLLTNGLTQNQVGNFPASGAVAATGSGSNSDASSGESVVSQVASTWWLEYNLGSAPGQTPNSNGYDINEIDVIAGHQDYRTGMQADVLVQYVGGNATDWFSLSNNNDFSFTGLGRGSAQMAIQGGGVPIAQNVRSVKFFAANDATWYRELVVTGVASAGVITGVNAPTITNVALDPTPGAVDVTFTTSPGGAQGYTVQRATVTGGVTGAFTTIGALVTTTNPTTYVDTSAAANTTYVYRIIAQNSGPSGIFTATSGNSSNLTTPPVGAEAHYYNMAYWEGPVTVSQGIAVVQLNWPSGSMAPGIRTTADSAVITGKVTPTESGTYTFYSNTDDDGYLYVNGVLVSSEPGGHGQRNAGSVLDINEQPLGFALPVSLTANTSYDFVLLEHNSGGGAGANLVWKNADGITQVVPSGVLSPISDAPTAPTNLTVTATNANFVNFSFTGQNNAVVHYILQRAYSSSPTVWTTVAQIDPGSDSYAANLAISTSSAHAGMIIADSSPLPGSTYFYRVAAVNYDGVAATPIVQATLTSQADLVSPPTAAVTLGTAADAAGMAAGTYFVKYSWVNAATGITTASAETSIVTTGVGDVTVALPAAPAGAVNGNVYISSVAGAERLVGNAIGGGTVIVRGLPITSAAAAPTSDTAGLVAGTYFVAYTWAGNESTVTGESSYASISNASRSLVSNETSIVLTGTNDIVVNGFPPAPPGVGSVNVYIGTSSGGERFIGSTTPTGSLVINTLPSSAAKALPQAQVNNTATVSSTVGATTIPVVTGTNPAGVEIHAYNQELFRRTTLNSVVEASAVAQAGLAAEYISQTTNQTYLGGLYAGPIDRDYTAQPPTAVPVAPPSSPDPTLFPDYDRIHTESFSQAFTGTLTPNISGVYTIISNSDDDSLVWLDGTVISGDLGGHGQQDALPPAATYTNQPTRSGDTLIPVFLIAGHTYDLTMFMGNTGGGSGAHLKWVEPPAFGGTNTGNVLFGSNADQTGATLSFNDPVNGSITGNYNNYTVTITAGPGAGQAGTISNYNTQTKLMTVNVITNGNNALWSTVPTSASKFQVNWVAAVPLQGNDAYPVAIAAGNNDGLSLHQDLPVQGTWSTASGIVTLTTSASAAQNVTITQISPTAGVSLSWSDQGLDELWYEVQRSTDGVNFSTIGTTPMNVGTTFTDTTAGNAFGSPTISYFYRVRGVNFDGAGPFSPIINSKNNVLIAAPQIAQAIQGAPGTIGLVFSGGSQAANGLDVQYATLSTGGVTGTFVDATPLGLPFNTFDYQVTGLVPTQQYVFKVRNLPGNNNVNSSLFGTPIAFTPTGGVQEAFGTPGSAGATPGTAVGGFVGTGSTIGDVLVNTNSSLTGTGVPTPATPATPVLTTPVDMVDPGFLSPITSVTSAADAPAPTTAGTFFTSPSNFSLSGASSVFLEYTWVTANGETLPFSAPVSFSIPSNGYILTYAVPTAPAGFGITNANIYIGTSSSPSAELLLGQATPGTSTVITTFAPAGAKSAPTLSTTGIPQGTYFVKYAWVNSAGQTTNSSSEQTLTLTNSSNDLFLPVPTPAPANATNFNLYIGTVAGGERLSANVAANTTTLALRGIPISSAAAPPTTNTAGLPAGTYFLQYTWNGTLPNETSQSNESLASPLTSIVITTPGEDVALAVPASPAGTGNANIYFGTGPNVHSPVVPVVLATQADAVGLAAATYFVKYTWRDGTGETGTSAEQSIVAGAASDVLVTLPAAPAGVVNGNIYISTNSGGEKLAGTFAAATTATISALPATNAVTPPANTAGLFLLGQAAGGTTFLARTVPTTGNRPPIPGTVLSGPATITAVADTVVAPTTTLTIVGTQADATSTIVAGTYYLKYTWTGNGGETTGSPEQTVVLGATGDIGYSLPAIVPAGVSNANIYLGSTLGGETFVTAVAANTTGIIVLKTLPASNAVTPPAASTVGLPVGTYYVAYTWTSGTGLETAGSTEQTVVVTTANSDINVVPPVNPVGQSSTRVYIGTAPGQEFFSNTVASLATLTIRSLPNIDARIVPTVNSQAYRLTTPANTLQIVNNNNSQQGNAFNLGENLAGFTTSFDFELNGNTSADGFGIVFTPDSRTFTGGGGGSMSYAGTSPGMGNSVGIFFQTYTGSSALNSTGLGVNGTLPSGGNGASAWINMTTNTSGAPTGVVLSNGNAQDQRTGDVFDVTVAYNNTTHILTENVYDVTLKARGVNNGFSTSYSIDLVATVGMPAAYVGFVGASGGASAEKDILNWTFSNSSVVSLDTITGTTGVDQITLTQDADHSHIDWTEGATSGQLLINDPNGLTINGNGSNDVITLNYANGNPLPNSLKLNGIFTINGLQGTAPLAGTTVDIKTSTVYIPYGTLAADPIALIQSYLKTGYNNNTWTGTSAAGSILSSSAAANTNQYSIGYADSADAVIPAIVAQPNTIELRYTVIGDTNLDGTVGGADYAAVVQNYGNGTKWDQGDVTYEAKTGGADYAAVVQHYGNTASSPAATPAAAPAVTPAVSPATSTVVTTNSSLPAAGSSVTLGSSSSSTTADSSSDSTNSKKKKAAKVKKH